MFNASIVVIVIGASLLVTIRAVASVMSYVRRSYDDMLREEKVIGALRGGLSERAVANLPPAVCSE
jgi:hypothetical protein